MLPSRHPVVCARTLTRVSDAAGVGSVTHWNAFVANLEMHGQGTFLDSRLNDASRFPVAAKALSGNTRSNPDMITSSSVQF